VPCWRFVAVCIASHPVPFFLQDPYFLIPIARNGQANNNATGKPCYDAVPISRAMKHAGSFLRLKDSVIDQIEATTTPELEPARDLIERYRNRDLYKCAASKVLRSQHSQLHRRIWDKAEEDIVDEILMYKGKHTGTDGKELTLSRDDVIVLKCDIHHGQKDADPLTKMRFLEKSQLNKIAADQYLDLPVADEVHPSEYESRLPRTLREFSLRVYCRTASKLELLTHVFTLWWDQIHSELSMTMDRSDSDNVGSLPISQEDYPSDDDVDDRDKLETYNIPFMSNSSMPWCSPSSPKRRL
jgi:hypothetical protein